MVGKKKSSDAEVLFRVQTWFVSRACRRSKFSDFVPFFFTDSREARGSFFTKETFYEREKLTDRVTKLLSSFDTINN